MVKDFGDYIGGAVETGSQVVQDTELFSGRELEPMKYVVKAFFKHLEIGFEKFVWGRMVNECGKKSEKFSIKN